MALTGDTLRKRRDRERRQREELRLRGGLNPPGTRIPRGAGYRGPLPPEPVKEDPFAVDRERVAANVRAQQERVTSHSQQSRQLFERQAYAEKMKGVAGVQYGAPAQATPTLMAPEREQVQTALAQERTPTQQWADVNTAVAAEIVPPGGKSQIAPPLNMFGGGAHLDSALHFAGRTEENKADWAVYKHLTDDVVKKIDTAFARRGEMPHSMKEAQDFIDSIQGIDDRVGEFVEQHVTRKIEERNPELYKEIIGQEKVRQAEGQSYIDWYRVYSDDPATDSKSDEEILASMTPVELNMAKRDERFQRYDYDPATGTVVMRPPRVPIAEEQRAQVASERRVEKDYERAMKFEDALLKSAYNNYLKQAALFTDDVPEDVTAAYEANVMRIKEMTAEKQATEGEPIEALEGELPVMTPEQAIAAGLGTRFKDERGNIYEVPSAPARGTGEITMGGRTERTPEPIAPAPVPVAPVTPTEPETPITDLTPIQEPIVAKPTVAESRQTKKEELLAKAPEVSQSDILKGIGRDIKSGILTVKEIADVAEKKYLEINAMLRDMPLDIAKWEIKLGKSSFNKVVKFMENREIEKRVEAQLDKEFGK